MATAFTRADTSIVEQLYSVISERYFVSCARDVTAAYQCSQCTLKRIV